MEAVETLIEVRNLAKHFPVGAGMLAEKPKTVKAVDGIPFKINRGETFGLVGESGCGKSTTGNLILRLLPATSGEVLLNGVNIQEYSEKQFRKLRKDLQIIFQNSSCALDPKMTIEDILSEPLLIHKIVPRTEVSRKFTDCLSSLGYQSSLPRNFPMNSAEVRNRE